MIIIKGDICCYSHSWIWTGCTSKEIVETVGLQSANAISGVEGE